MRDVDTMGKHVNRLIIIAMLVTAGLLVPGTVAVFPGGQMGGPVVTAPDLNVSGVDMANSTIPARYQTSPVPIHVEVTISETLLPGPKGEMAAGPRTIGFSAEPVSLTILVVAILAGAAGVWYLANRKPEETEREDEDKESGK
jgi:hypothetical protein